MTNSQTLNDETLNDVENHAQSIHALSADSDRQTNTNDDDEHEFDDGIASARFKKLQKKLRKEVSWAIRDFNMIEDGDDDFHKWVIFYFTF